MADVTHVDWAPSLKLVPNVQCYTTNSSETCDAWTQSDEFITQDASTQCCAVSKRFVDVGTQTELNKNKDVGVSCSFRSVCNGSAAEPVFSSQSTQGFSSQGSDITYHPHDSEEMEYEQECSLSRETKFIVYKRCLAELLQSCPVCGLSCQITWREIGTFVSTAQQCSNCTFSRKWSSQPMIQNYPAGNLLISAAIYLNGASFSKMSRVFATLNVASISSSTFYRHIQQFVQPTILSVWNSHQQQLVSCMAQRSGSLILGGDMRADSPGHSAKYGSYTMMDLTGNRVVDISLIQSNEVGGSSHMEKAALMRSLSFLQQSGLSIDAIVTDRHPAIQKYLRDAAPSIHHYYDVWHVAKGVCKKLEAVANKKGCAEVRPWIHSIVNHLYWSASTSDSGEETIAKWSSVANHIQNVHVHDNWHFPLCQHPPINAHTLTKWLISGTEACEHVCRIILNRQLLADVAKLSPLHQTSSIESFHALILRFAPKTCSFSYLGMLCRLHLAALHFNENADRPQAFNSIGKPQFSIHFPKFKKGEYTVKPVKEAATYGYIHKLLDLMFSEVVYDPQTFLQLCSNIAIPPALCSSFDRPSELTMSSVTSRFRK